MAGIGALTLHAWSESYRAQRSFAHRIEAKPTQVGRAPASVELGDAMNRMLVQLGAQTVARPGGGAGLPPGVPAPRVPGVEAPEIRWDRAIYALRGLPARDLSGREHALWELRDLPEERREELHALLREELDFETPESAAARGEQMNHALSLTRLWIEAHRTATPAEAGPAYAQWLGELTHPVLRSAVEGYLIQNLPADQRAAWFQASR